MVPENSPFSGTFDGIGLKKPLFDPISLKRLLSVDCCALF
jgi:hypothetical protein